MKVLVALLTACAAEPVEHVLDESLLSAPVDLSNTAAPSTIYYNFGNNLAVDGRGQVHAVWNEGASSSTQVAYRRSSDNGSTWSPMALFGLSTMTGGARVAAAGDNVYIAWQGLYEGFLGIYVLRSSDAGATFHGPTRVSDAGINASYPSIAATGSEVDIVWSDNRTDHAEIYLRRSTDAGASFATTLQVSSTDHHSSWTPSVAAFGGAVHVAWTDERWDTVDCADINDTSKCHEEEYYRRWTPAGLGPETRLTFDTGAPKSSWAPSIAAGQDGVVHVAFFDQRTDVWRIYYQRSTDGGTTWTEQLISDPADTQPAMRPVLSVLGSNVRMVYWRGPAPPTGASDIWMTGSSDSGATWATPFALTHYIGTSTESALTPMVALSPNGTNHMVWMLDTQEIIYDRLQ
jgi:hypothetical protein